ICMKFSVMSKDRGMGSPFTSELVPGKFDANCLTRRRLSEPEAWHAPYAIILLPGSSPLKGLPRPRP
ncbi:MAG: hypothetical protein JW882_05015, partial [Deltaproteobacteria bacterium]|nr:hypothetical protein [Deltaproteobacteria bacterium]